jgi:hypothetical protein
MDELTRLNKKRIRDAEAQLGGPNKRCLICGEPAVLEFDRIYGRVLA